MVRRPKAAAEGTTFSYAADDDLTTFVRRQPNYPLIDERDAVNIDWESDLEQRNYRGRIPREGYDQDNPSTRITIPNWDVRIDRPTATVPQTSHSPTVTINSPEDNDTVSAGNNIVIKADVIEYPYAAELYINGEFFFRKEVPDAEKGQQNRIFMFDYPVPAASAGQQVTIRVDVRGKKTNASGRFVLKSASTGSIEGQKRGIWSSYGNLTFWDYGIHGYDVATSPDFLFMQPDDTASVVINVI